MHNRDAQHGAGYCHQQQRSKGFIGDDLFVQQNYGQHLPGGNVVQAGASYPIVPSTV